MHGIISGVICGAFFGIVIVINLYKSSNGLKFIQTKLMPQIHNNIPNKKILLGPALFMHSTCTLFGLIIGAIYQAYNQKYEYALLTIFLSIIFLSIAIALLLKKYFRSFFPYTKVPLVFFIIIFGLLLPIITSK